MADRADCFGPERIADAAAGRFGDQVVLACPVGLVCWATWPASAGSSSRRCGRRTAASVSGFGPPGSRAVRRGRAGPRGRSRGRSRSAVDAAGRPGLESVRPCPGWSRSAAAPAAGSQCGSAGTPYEKCPFPGVAAAGERALLVPALGEACRSLSVLLLSGRGGQARRPRAVAVPAQGPAARQPGAFLGRFGVRKPSARAPRLQSDSYGPAQAAGVLLDGRSRARRAQGGVAGRGRCPHAAPARPLDAAASGPGPGGPSPPPAPGGPGVRRRHFGRAAASVVFRARPFCRRPRWWFPCPKQPAARSPQPVARGPASRRSAGTRPHVTRKGGAFGGADPAAVTGRGRCASAHVTVHPRGRGFTTATIRILRQIGI